eukprot:XP_001694586.1 predicted protein [Chlamydomonas reinhardtii]
MSPLPHACAPAHAFQAVRLLCANTTSQSAAGRPDRPPPLSMPPHQFTPCLLPRPLLQLTLLHQCLAACFTAGTTRKHILLCLPIAYNAAPTAACDGKRNR